MWVGPAGPCLGFLARTPAGAYASSEDRMVKYTEEVTAGSPGPGRPNTWVVSLFIAFSAAPVSGCF